MCVYACVCASAASPAVTIMLPLSQWHRLVTVSIYETIKVIL